MREGSETGIFFEEGQRGRESVSGGEQEHEIEWESEEMRVREVGREW